MANPGSRQGTKHRPKHHEGQNPNDVSELIVITVAVLYIVPAYSLIQYASSRPPTIPSNSWSPSNLSYHRCYASVKPARPNPVDGPVTNSLVIIMSPDCGLAGEWPVPACAGQKASERRHGNML